MAMSEKAREWYSQDFPLIDSIGTVWLDPSGFKSTRGPGHCFICGLDTYRIDINYGAFFCDQVACRVAIQEALDSLPEIKWPPETESPADEEKAGE